MKITQVTVSYGATQSLPSYSNVKPQLALTATIDDGDDPAAVEAELWALAKAHVHEQIDLALEANDQAAKYSIEPRYQVLQTYWNQWDHRGEEKPPQYVVILPNGISLNQDAYTQRLVSAAYQGDSRKLRYTHALAVARAALSDTDAQRSLLDCSDGDLTPLNLALSAPERTAPEHLEDTLDYEDSDRSEEGWRANDDSDDDGEYEEDEEPRDFVVEAMARAEARIANKPADDGPDNSM